MAQLNINIGSNANDGTGDDLRAAMVKINTNFTELYSSSPVSSQISITGNEIFTNQSNANLKLTASGTGVIEFEAVQISENEISANRSNDDLKLRGSGTGSVSIDGIQIKGTTISSSDSTQINVNENINVDGTLTGITLSSNLLVANTIRSDDSTAVQITDDVNILGTLTATTIAGVTALNNGQISDGTASFNASTLTNLDTFSATTFRSAKYTVSVSMLEDTKMALYDVMVTHDGTNAYITDTFISSSGTNLLTFSADIDGGNVRVRCVPFSDDTINAKFVRTAINL